MITPLRNLLSSFCIVALVSGCSGGGGGGSSSEPTLVITRSNAGAVADGAYSAQQDLGGTSDLIQGISPFAMSTDAVTGNSLLDLVAGLAERHFIGSGIIGPLEVSNCSGGGTVDITEDDGGNADPVGDSLTLDYSACTEIGLTIDGTVVLEVTGLIGDLGDPNSDWSLELTFTFADIVLTAGGDSSAIDGTLAFGISYDASQSSSTFSMSSSGLTVGGSSDGAQVSGAFSYSVTLSSNGLATVAFQFTATVGGGYGHRQHQWHHVGCQRVHR